MNASPPAVRRDTRWTPWIALALVAALITGFNAVKPLTVDDAAYYSFARQIAEHPLDPYGFEMLWYQQWEPANRVLAPPVLPCWWSLAIRLFGDSVVLWKLWLLPFAVTFVFALYALFRRFAPGIEGPLTAMTALSPAVLPGFNLMLDVPALALALAGLALFLRACDAGSFARALAAGAILGLAAQTKYTAVVALALTVIYAALSRRLACAAAALALAGLVFISWELFTASRYGESHFLANLGQSHVVFRLSPGGQALALLAIVGGVLPAVGLLCFVALGAGRGVIWTLAVAVALGYGALAWLPGELADAGRLADRFFSACGLVTVAAVVAVACRLWRHGRAAKDSARLDIQRDDTFLVLWLVLEVVAYFALSPFPAVRRVIALSVIPTLLAGRLAVRRGLDPRRLRLVRGVAAFGCALGLLYAAIDFADALTLKAGAEEAAARVRGQEPSATIWFAGHWGFQFYGERAGMRPVAPGRAGDPSASVLHAGDWLVMPDHRVHQQRLALDAADVEPSGLPPAEIPAVFPLRTLESYYVGTRPLQRTERGLPRLLVQLLRVRRTFTPRPPSG